MTRWIGALAAVAIAWNSAAVGGEVKQGGQGGREPWFVGASLLTPMTREVFKHIRQRSPSMPEPKIESNNLERDVQTFCSGTGADSPDVLAISRRMAAAEYETCVKNGVKDIVEIRIGLEALVLVALRQDAEFPLTFDTFYRALAAELPKGDDFLPNTAQTWHDVDQKLPHSDIHVIIPSRATASRPFFDSRFLQGACREIPEYKNIFAADERVAQCIALRKDGSVIEKGLPYNAATTVEALEKAPQGAIALLSLRYALEAADKLKMLSLEGVLPSRSTVGNLNYPATRRLHYYVKRTHVKTYEGIGPVVGLREFITEVTRESAIGDSGYLVPLGLVPLPPDRRDEMRRSALSLSRLER